MPNIMFWTGEGGRAGISKNVTNFVTNAGSQLTIMTQHEKVMIFGNPSGVATDLLDV